MKENVLLVTGASSDMGTSLINEIGGDYDYIIAQYRNMNPSLEKSLAQLDKKKVITLQANLMVERELDELVEQIKGGPAPTHFVHFPAPPLKNYRFHKINWDVFQEELNVSMKSFILVSQAILPGMLKQKDGKIVAMLSAVTTNIPPRYCSHYVTTKYAMLGLMKAMAFEYADKGVAVNGVSPCMVKTKFIKNLPEMIVNQERREMDEKNLEAIDVVSAITFLLSDAAKHIIGQNIMIGDTLHAV